jgi:hypothetical protein
MNIRPKFRRAMVMAYLGVPETWSQDGGKDAMIGEVERIMRSESIGCGPGGSTLHALFIHVVEPGTPDGDKQAATVEMMRVEYPLRHPDPHEPPPYPAEGLEFIGGISEGWLEGIYEEELLEPPVQVVRSGLGTKLASKCSCPHDDLAGSNIRVRMGDDPNCLLHHGG